MIYTSLWKACYLCPGARPHLQAWKVQAEVLCDLAILFILFGMSVGMVMEDSPSLLFATYFKFKLKKIRLQEVHEGFLGSSWVAFDLAIFAQSLSSMTFMGKLSINGSIGIYTMQKIYVGICMCICNIYAYWCNHVCLYLIVYMGLSKGGCTQ